MPDKESKYPADWFAQGEKDLKRVEPRLKEGDLADAAFHLQQALEKYLKGYLLSRGWRLRRTHNLESLLDESVKHDADFEKFRPICQEVTAYYFQDRYPFLTVGPSRKEIESALKQAKDLVKKIKGA